MLRIAPSGRMGPNTKAGILGNCRSRCIRRHTELSYTRGKSEASAPIRSIRVQEEWSCTILQPAGVRAQIVVNQPVRSGRPPPVSTY